MRLGDLAARLGGSIVGDPDVDILGVREPAGARPGMIVYAADARAVRVAEAEGATALLLPLELEPQRLPAIRVQNSRLAFARLLELFTSPPAHDPGVHSTAVLGADVALGADVHIGPYVVLGDHVRIGPRTALLAGTVIGSDVTIGEDCLIYPHVTIRERCVLGDRVILHPGVVVGSDGFGYARGESGPVKIPHLGRVVIEDDVEIGANATIDRGTLGETRVGASTKIDNLVQIAHNVHIGRHVLIAAQVGLAGSITVGNDVMLAGQVGVREHTHIGAGAVVLGQSGVSKDVPPGETVWGRPAQPHRDELRILALLRRLPELVETVERLQRVVADLTGRAFRKDRSKR